MPTPTFLVGIDLDHTLISYARGLRRWAETLGITISPGDSLKDAVRQNCWNSAEGDVAWQRIQADLYGPGMNDAEVMPGARAFLHWLDRNRIPAVVVSHKTVFAAAAPDGPNLRETALAWMAAQGLFSPETGLTRERVYFAATRAEKAARIAALGCTHFIDDLPAVFLDPGFPLGVRSVLFAPDGANEDGAWSVVSSWDDAGRRIAHDLELPWHELPTEIHGTPVVNTARLHGGRNSSVYRLDCSDGARYAAKCYESTERMTREAEALRYLNARSIPSIPSLASMDSPAAVVYEFIPGTSPVTDVSEADIDVAMGFIRAINTPPRDGWERSAAEAVFSLSEVEDTIRARTQRLLETPADTPLHDDMRAFVRGTLLGLLAELAPCDPTPLAARGTCAESFRLRLPQCGAPSRWHALLPRF
ncbi:hypothetical protein [Roseovarius pacificus]|uniref:hypothetical protein n=1 Tax=Roseovarius pacificus TaxID=337701 RepID=UPI002A18A73F|nr:hypothetical protein [Roseovarius pacificus]